MSTFLSKVIAVASVAVLCQTALVRAESETKQYNMEATVHDLQDAKKSDKPLEGLESAKKALQHAKHNKHGERHAAMAFIDEAIERARAGDLEKMKQKIDAAIADLHSGMSKTKK